MKKLLFIITIIISVYIQAQNKFVYNFLPNENQKTSSKILTDVVKSSSDPIEYFYILNHNKASFKPILKIDNSQTIEIDLLKISVKSLGEYYYDYDKKEIENRIEFSSKEYVVTSSFDDLHWIDTNEKEVINGYQTKKYITKRKEKGLKNDKIYTTTIWIDENYPKDIAPFGLMGLNGLIVKVNFNGGNELILNKIEDERIKEIQPFKSKNRITKAEYKNIIDEQMEILRNKRQERLNFKD